MMDSKKIEDIELKRKGIEIEMKEMRIENGRKIEIGE